MWFDDFQKLMAESGESVFWDAHYYKSVDSTNEVVKREAVAHAEEGLVVIGEEQTAGKGRLGRRWESPKGESIYFSFLLRPDFPADHSAALTLVMGLSVAQAARELYALPVQIKWPNDVVISGKKICGILTEAQIAAELHRPDFAESSQKSSKNTKLDYVVIGTGINVNNTSFAPELSDRATSLRMELGREVPRAQVLARVLQKFHRNYEIYRKTFDLGGLLTDYNDLLVSLNRNVRVEDPKEPYIGKSLGIDNSGCLLVELEDGTVRRVATGEVSVRGLYGYV